MLVVKELLIKSYNDKGLKASGQFECDLELIVEQNDKVIKAKILGSYHTYFMEGGRKPNRQQTIKQARGLGYILEQWVKDKGISVNPYAAAWKIVREGISVPNKHNSGKVIENVVNDAWLNSFSDKLNDKMTEIIKSDMLKVWQQ